MRYSTLAAMTALLLMSCLSWRVNHAEEPETWPLAIASDERPSVRLQFKDFQRVHVSEEFGEVKTYVAELPEERDGSWNAQEFMTNPERRALLERVLKESGLFSEVTTNPGARADLVITASYYKKWNAALGWHAVVFALTFTVFPHWFSEQNMLTLEVERNRTAIGSVDNLENQNKLVTVLVLPLSVLQYFPYVMPYENSQMERLIQGALAQGASQGLFEKPAPTAAAHSRVATPRFLNVGRVFQLFGQRRIVVFAPGSSRLRPGQTFSLSRDGANAIGSIRVVSVQETRFIAEKVGGEDAAVGMSVGVIR